MIIFKALKEKILPTKNTLLGKIDLHNLRRKKNFPNKQKLKKFITTRLASQKMLERVLETETKDTN